MCLTFKRIKLAIIVIVMQIISQFQLSTKPITAGETVFVYSLRTDKTVKSHLNSARFHFHRLQYFSTCHAVWFSQSEALCCNNEEMFFL